MIDIHCHILPGIDDGSPSLDQSLQMGRIAQEEGITKIVATPHVYRSKYLHGGFETIREKAAQLNQAFQENQISVEIFTGAEVYVTHKILQQVRENREDLTLNHTSYMFLEFPTEHVFSRIKNLLFQIMSEEITPIIAHPERNRVFSKRPFILYELLQMGALAQANAGSFLGLYGRSAERAAFYLLKMKMIHFLASDGHNPHTSAPRFSEALEQVSPIIGEREALALVKDNPKAVVKDKPIPYYPEPVSPQKKKSFPLKIPHFFKPK